MSSLRDLLHPIDESPFSSPGSAATPLPSASASSTPITYLTIEYIFDTICPHCYVGLRHLENAITIYGSRYPDVDFEVVFTPLILEPSLYKPVYDKVGHPFWWPHGAGSSRGSHMLLRLALEASPSYVPSIGLTKHQSRPNEHTLRLDKEVLARAKGSSAAKLAAEASPAPSPTIPRAALHGNQTPSDKDNEFQTLVSSSPFVMPAPAMLPQSRGPNLQLSLALAFCRGYFEHNLDISNQSTLVDIAVRVLGFSEAEIRACLGSEEWARLVEVLSIEARTRLQQARPNAEKPASVPTLIFQGRFVHQGWPKVDALLALFDDLREGRRPRGPNP